jgi:hypothetical protein
MEADRERAGSTPAQRLPQFMHDAMSTPNRSLKQELHEYNTGLDGCLRSRFGMSLRVFKVVKASTQLVGAGAGVYAMSLGADPMTAFALIAFIVSGPEALEYLINEAGSGN